MQNIDALHQFRFAAESFNNLLKRIDTDTLRASFASKNKEEYVEEEEDEFSPAGILEIGSRILYGFQHGDVVKAKIGKSDDVLCVISDASKDGFRVHSTQWDSGKNTWKFQNEIINIGDITSFVGSSFNKEAAIKNASRFHR